MAGSPFLTSHISLPKFPHYLCRHPLSLCTTMAILNLISILVEKILPYLAVALIWVIYTPPSIAPERKSCRTNRRETARLHSQLPLSAHKSSHASSPLPNSLQQSCPSSQSQIPHVDHERLFFIAITWEAYKEWRDIYAVSEEELLALATAWRSREGLILPHTGLRAINIQMFFNEELEFLNWTG
jgi:hypothetical protein